MYGEEASKLARETKRTIDHFPPYNDPLVRSITREIRHLHETCLENHIREATQPLTEIFWTKYLVHMTPLQRNKRILMAYHFQRIEKIKELAWAYNTLPESSRRLLSPDEILFFSEYEKQCRNKYTSQMEFNELDLGLGMISPPKEVFITVRVLKDCGDIVTESGATLSLKKNSEHFVKRGDVERLITQGYLVHVA
ncbi:DNA replication complex GINS protein PSF1 [Lobosporangium transversale]|uniref:DNA replication complex GINS protein PSF1 n=1 Tax=Lobosporangium transversale TaxID=64571 RepID=A0A1Y2GVH7_9FUNG|nr:DNA replication complex GINS protein PSF1 [Lobosporangium transversale]ORZ23702.1 DNA replication complex GINS protein PSF1 [Lobosporangium transversale]|eukprot:XP_021883516.1 DNA replication complex GINS protein PSF1 [Lobosporangium transversale]